jgi:pimeloyl-ACP methyl ester carboxylesterase/DNA-binding CsgD family transcriptional regulator
VFGLVQKSALNEHIVDAVYDTALSPQKFERLISAWDEEFGHSSFDTFQQSIDAATQSLLKHFERADQIFLSTQNAETHSTQVIVDHEPTSAFICDSKGRILAVNTAASTHLGIHEGDKISALPLNANTHKVLEHILHSSNLQQNTHTSNAIRGVNTANNQVFVLVAQRLFNTQGCTPQRVLPNQSAAPLFLFKSSLATWHRGIEQILTSAFELTKTEIEIVEGLNKGLSLKDMAENRQRSLDTVRTQMKSILLKTETQNQTTLMRHVTSLVLLANDLDDKQLALKPHVADIAKRKLVLASGEAIHYRLYGSAKSLCVLCLFPIYPSQLPSKLVDVFLQKGLSLLILDEVESQVLSFKSSPDAYSEMLNHHLAVLEHLHIDQVDLLGLCVGGVYSVEFARRFANRVKSVICVDTGAPLQDKAQWDKISTTARRTFAIARKFPSFLLMPHRLVAHRFFSGLKGQEQVINYFYADHPPDINKVNSNSMVKQWSTDMLTYCFNDIKRPIRACEMWVQNWYPALQEVLQNTPVYFIHGDKNPQFHIEDLYLLEKRHPKLQVVPTEGASQLSMITHTELIAMLIADKQVQKSQ